MITKEQLVGAGALELKVGPQHEWSEYIVGEEVRIWARRLVAREGVYPHAIVEALLNNKRSKTITNGEVLEETILEVGRDEYVKKLEKCWPLESAWHGPIDNVFHYDG